MSEKTTKTNQKIQRTKGEERTGVRTGGVGDGVEEPKEGVMVHSGSASPVKTTPSASPHLTVPATAPPLQVAPLVPPSGDTTDQDLTQTPANLLTTDLTSNSDLTLPSTLTPADAEPPVVTPATALATNSSPSSAWSSTQTPTPAQGLVNGRTSGRKRTPKACDCCGPNSRGHDVRTSGRGRGKGRARGRGRGAGSDLCDTPKRKVDGQLTHIKSFDLTQETVEEAEDEGDRYENMQTTVVVADTQSPMPVAPPVTASPQDGPIRNYATPEKGEAPKKVDMLIEGSGDTDAGEKGGGDSRDVEMRLSGMAGRGAPLVRGRGRGGRGMVGAMSASKIDEEGGIKREDSSSVVISSKTYALPRLLFVQRQGQNKGAEMDHGLQTDLCSVKSPVVNGDTVNLSDTEPEEEAKENSMFMGALENGLQSISRQPGPASRSGSPQDLDSEMQVDQTPYRTDSPLTLSNGNVSTPTNDDHCSTLMEVETSHQATVAPPSPGPITVSSMQHGWALRDHRLYCQPGTWEKIEVEEVLGKDHSGEREMDGMMQDKESLEQLTDMIHGKMCF